MEKVLGLGQVEVDNTVLKAAEAKAKIMEEFERGYENPLSFASAGELDKTIDAYQELYEANADFVDLLNEASGIKFENGHPLSEDFSEVIDTNIETAEGFQTALLTINELFEDMSEADLSKMFGEDVAEQIQSVLDIDLTTPWEEMSDSAKAAVAEVMGSFNEMEDSCLLYTSPSPRDS